MRAGLLTGASGGIGTVTASVLGATGAKVVAQYRGNAQPAADALAGVPDERKLLLRADLASPQAARELWRAALAWSPDLDVVVLNAAAIPSTPVDGPDEEWDAGWQEALQVNVIGTGALLREAARHFVAHGGGTIVVLSSWAAEQGSRLRDVSAYAASKAAIRNLAQTFARNHARDGLRVYVVAPGVVRAGMGVAGLDEPELAAVADGLAMGRHVEPDEVARLVAFLATGACPSLTGATLDLNGASYIR